MDQGYESMFAFGILVKLAWQKIDISFNEHNNEFMYHCDSNQFYLRLPDIAHFLAIPTENSIIIEKATEEISIDVLNTWLLGTMMAYILQYHDYTVLHGSAVLINGGAVIFSGQSGAGKSTLASALVQKGYPFITDDLVVIKRNHQGQYCIIPGPAKLKLWQNAMQHFNYDINYATPVSLKDNKYAVHVADASTAAMIPITTFYELTINNQAEAYHCETFHAAASLKTLMQNAYRYFMLKPLGKMQTFFQDCSALHQQITVHRITRTAHFHELPKIIQRIEINQGITP